MSRRRADPPGQRRPATSATARTPNTARVPSRLAGAAACTTATWGTLDEPRRRPPPSAHADAASLGMRPREGGATADRPLLFWRARRVSGAHERDMAALAGPTVGAHAEDTFPSTRPLVRRTAPRADLRARPRARVRAMPMPLPTPEGATPVPTQGGKSASSWTQGRPRFRVNGGAVGRSREWPRRGWPAVPRQRSAPRVRDRPSA